MQLENANLKNTGVRRQVRPLTKEICTDKAKMQVVNIQVNPLQTRTHNPHKLAVKNVKTSRTDTYAHLHKRRQN
jgi:hypothetical protein